MSAKFDRIKKQLDDYWGFTLTRNEPNDMPRWNGCWNTGFTVQESGMGRTRWIWFKTLKEVEETYLMEDGKSVFSKG